MLEKQVRTTWTCKKTGDWWYCYSGTSRFSRKFSSWENWLQGLSLVSSSSFFFFSLYLIGFNASSPTRNYLDTETHLIAILRLYMNLLKCLWLPKRLFCTVQFPEAWNLACLWYWELLKNINLVNEWRDDKK